jgi:hypothetical protein
LTRAANAQVIADENQVILAAAVTNQANDVRQVEPIQSCSTSTAR